MNRMENDKNRPASPSVIHTHTHIIIKTRKAIKRKRASERYFSGEKYYKTTEHNIGTNIKTAICSHAYWS